MNIKGKITGIKYKIFLSEDLQTVEIDEFDINKTHSFCLLKDGLLKMILYSNLCEVEVDGKPMKSKAVLKLTSPKISVGVTSEYEIWDRPVFLLNDNISQEQVRFVDTLLDEAVENGFLVKITN